MTLETVNTLKQACLDPAWALQKKSLPNSWDVILRAKATEFTFTLPTRGAAFRMTHFDEQRALEGLRQLDSQSIAAIYDQYFAEIYRYVRYRVSDDAVAEDIASDVFVRMIEASRKNKGPQTNLRGWLISTALNVVNDHHRRQYRRPQEALSDTVPDPGTSLRAEIDMREQNRLVQRALAQLTAEQQHVLVLRFGEGFSLEETAVLLKKNVNAVKALQFRALAALQRHIGETIYE